MSVSPASRRSFLGHAGLLSATAAVLPSTVSADEATDQRPVVVGVMGASRGAALAEVFGRLPNVEVRYVCDVDQNRVKALQESLAAKLEKPVQAIADFRRILDDPQVDALICAAPNHWHAPAGILACAAGKHAYVEKPCSYNPEEGELLVQAARKHAKCVQMGNQRRSSPTIQKAMQRLQENAIGRVYYSRSWYAATRGTIGTGTPAPVPPHIDYELWQGPAARKPFTSNRLHYNWHWVWHYGNGELGNNGIHSIDLSRWGLQVDYPIRVVSSGGRYAFSDDQQTADTHVVSFEFPDRRQIVWECLSCNRHGLDGTGFGVSFHGENGSLKLNDSGYTILDARGKEVEKQDGADGMRAHAENFVTAIRRNDPTLLNSEIEQGHKSTLLCHLGNIAHRTGEALTCDATNGRVKNSPAAMQLWSREYAEGWRPKV
ncbi:MAG TPA: dehydrogenase [Planctomycetaceae bacterium]|nr:dehydrogenase [Planctomycetaceae bacterium]